jgi:hypothetical protein
LAASRLAKSFPGGDDFSWRRPSGPQRRLSSRRFFVALAIFVAGDFACGYAATRLGQFWLQAAFPVARLPTCFAHTSLARRDSRPLVPLGV